MTKLHAPSFQLMADKWPSPFVARQEVERFTGGIINSKYLANLDSQNLGPKGRIRVGRKIAYPVSEFIQWLESRSSAVTTNIGFRG
jgi:hypothetical protein